MKGESLKEGLDRSANKRGFSDGKRHQYIGGALRNMQKRGEISLKKRAVTPPKPKPAPKARAPRKPKEAQKPRERLVLTVKKNGPASSTRSYDVYSLYKEGQKEPFSSATYRKRSAAQQAARVEMESYNHPKGIHMQKRLVR